MSGPKTKSIYVSSRQRLVIESLERASSTTQQLAERCRIILLATEGQSNEGMGRALGVNRQLVRRWRSRWANRQNQLAEAEKENASDK
ncbi:MAG: helix-turn-helix domain-containing protein, partial [Deltaproteobacteria bacterium]|nr:helix-turn-helix domain-containing protein [Deltaproteobacteria bacterium]